MFKPVAENEDAVCLGRQHVPTSIHPCEPFEVCPHSASQNMGGACEACTVKRGNKRFEEAKKAILADMAAGTVPATVREFSVLHDYVDANMYLEAAYIAGGLDAANPLVDRLDKWLRERAADFVLDEEDRCKCDFHRCENPKDGPAVAFCGDCLSPDDGGEALPTCQRAGAA